MDTLVSPADPLHTDSDAIAGADYRSSGKVPARFASPDSGLTIPRLDLLRRNPDLVIVALLLLLTACGSRGFSQALQIGPIYVTEVTMGLAGLIALVRLGIGRSWLMLRRLPLLALAVIWVVGAIATLRGLGDYSVSFVSDDIGLVDYTLILPLFALVLADRERYDAMFAILVGCGFVGIATFFVTFSADQITGTADSLIALQGQAAGLYMSLAVAWVAARLAHGVPTPRWLIAVAPVGLLLMFLTTQRSVWIIALLSLGAVVLLAPASARLRSASAAAAALAVAFVLAIGVEAAINATLGGVEGRTQTTAKELDGEGDGGDPTLVRELSSFGGGDSAQTDNITWRLAYWEEIVSRVPSAPLLGVGFGQPAAFVWNDRKYDFRDGDPGSGIDVAGPHNSFVSWVYRLGIPAALALVFLLFVAARNVWRTLREESPSTGERVMLVTLVAMLGSGIAVSSFNESLTGPFLGLFFWAPLAMLLLWSTRDATAPARRSEPATPPPAR